jgi:hypothetical protein
MRLHFFSVVALASLSHPMDDWFAPGHAVVTAVAWAALCTHAVAMLSNGAVKEMTEDLKVFTYDLAGQGFMPPLEAFSMQSPECKECAGLSYPLWTECNYGYGVPEPSPIAATHQGMLWRGAHDSAVHAHYRLTRSGYATTNASEAKLFFIPIYPVLSKYPAPHPYYCGPLIKYPNYARMWTWLRNQTSYQRSNGADHFMMVFHPWAHAKEFAIFNELGLDESGLQPDAISAERAKFANIAKLVVDTDADNPGRYLHPLSDDDIAAHKNALRGLISERVHPERVLQVPYSTSIHYFYTPSPWTVMLSGRASKLADSAQQKHHVHRERPFFATYLTTVRHGQAPDTEYLMVKRKMLHLCVKDHDCKVHLLDPGVRERSVTHLAHHIANESSILSDLGLAELHQFIDFAKDRIETMLYLSQFCLTPPGDTVSRKGLFDAILMGCIPVVFYPMTAYYPWHLPTGNGPEGLDSFAVYIPGRDMLRDPSIVMDRLRNIPREQVTAMREKLVALAPRIQYMASLGEESAGKHQWSEGGGWGPDALDIALAGVLNATRGVN